MEPSTTGAPASKTKVLIIGAGMAGLSAAYHLSKNGFNDYRLLEARKRVGGRILQIQVGAAPLELGANWIHGVLGNPVYELAMQHGLVDILHAPPPHRVIASTETGRQVPFATLHEIYDAYLTFLRRCEEYSYSQYQPPAGVDSVGAHLRLEIGLYLERCAEPGERHLRRLLFDCLLRREACISGCDDMREVDLLELGTYTELQGGNITLPAGYSAILGPLLAAVPEANRLLGRAVRRVVWAAAGGDESDDSDRTVVGEPTAGVEVVCESGERFEAAQVICTVPLGVLKHTIDTLFEPPLPAYKRDAIERLLFGTVDKIVLEFERPFLNPNITEVLLLWEPEAEQEMCKCWFKKIYSFAKVSDTVILGWISGKEAEYMETLTKEAIIDACTLILRKFLNDPFIPKPKNVITTSWHSQQFTRGSYTAIAVGASQIDIECLAQPLYSDAEETKPVVLFAGEHTHSNFYSTVHGAYLTGRTAAQIILNDDYSKNEELILNCDEDNVDLSAWVQGICLE